MSCDKFRASGPSPRCDVFSATTPCLLLQGCGHVYGGHVRHPASSDAIGFPLIRHMPGRWCCKAQSCLATPPSGGASRYKPASTRQTNGRHSSICLEEWERAWQTLPQRLEKHTATSVQARGQFVSPYLASQCTPEDRQKARSGAPGIHCSATPRLRSHAAPAQSAVRSSSCRISTDLLQQ